MTGILGGEELVAFVPSTDLDRSRAFFVDVLGLTEIETTPYACVLQNGAVTLRVTLVDELAPPPFTVLGWAVDDIAATGRRLVEAGVPLTRYDGMGQDDLGVWHTPSGDQVAWFRDPDGSTLSLTQLAASEQG